MRSMCVCHVRENTDSEDGRRIESTSATSSNEILAGSNGINQQQSGSRGGGVRGRRGGMQGVVCKDEEGIDRCGKPWRERRCKLDLGGGLGTCGVEMSKSNTGARTHKET